jgi:hypothetical protein
VGQGRSEPGGHRWPAGAGHPPAPRPGLILAGPDTSATATYYEILGVGSDASHDDIKRAYTEAALRWHPDRRHDTTDEARETADFHIREINAAWEVLRSPGDRAAYDDRLRVTTDAPASTVGRASRPPVAARGPSFDDRLVDPRDAAWEGGRRGRRWVPVVVILVVAALVVTVTAYASHPHNSPSGPGSGGQVSTGWQVGSCVAVMSGPSAVVVPCDQPHTGTVAATTDYPRPCPPETYTVALVADNVSLCLKPS